MKSPPETPSGAPSWKGVALSALAGGITGGLNTNPQLFNLTNSPAVNTALRMATANALTQGIGVATGLQKKFDWKGVAASAAGGFAGAAVGARLPEGLDPFLGKIVTGFAAGTAAAVARGGRVAIQQVAVDAFGNALGEALVAGSGQAAGSRASAREDRLGAFIEQNQGTWNQRQSNYDQMVDAFGNRTAYGRADDVLLAAGPGYSGGMGQSDRDRNIARMLSQANEAEAMGFGAPLGGAPSGMVDMAPTKANAMRLGLMGPDGQAEGAWSSSVTQSNVVGVPLPPLDANDRIAYIAAAALGGEFSVLSAELSPDIASGYAGPAGAMVRDPVGTFQGLVKSGYNNTIGGLAGMAVKGGAYLEAGDMLMSGAILGIDTRDEAMNLMARGRAGESLILAHPTREGQQVGMALGDMAALGSVVTSAFRGPLTKALDMVDTYEINKLMRSDLASQDYVYRLVKSTDLIHYERANAISGRGGAPTYFSLDTAPTIPEHMLGAQMNPAYGPYDTLLRIPKAELVEPQVPRLRGYDPVQPSYGREYSTAAYPEYGQGGYRQIMGTTRTYSPNWVVQQTGK